MRKLHLKIEELAVESFQTDKGEKGGGTVRGHGSEPEYCASQDSQCATCQPWGCPGDTNTCYFQTCGRTDGLNVCFGC